MLAAAAAAAAVEPAVHSPGSKTCSCWPHWLKWGGRPARACRHHGLEDLHTATKLQLQLARCHALSDTHQIWSLGNLHQETQLRCIGAFDDAATDYDARGLKMRCITKSVVYACVLGQQTGAVISEDL